MIEIMNGNCLELMKNIPRKSIDMILCDLPYQRTQNQWDIMIPMQELWEEYKRVIKDNGAIALFADGMFMAELMISNKKMWKYNLVWDKVAKTGFLNANRMPLRQHEDICIFYKKLPTYNPQMTKCDPHKRNHSKGNMEKQQKNSCYGKFVEVPTRITDEKYPTSIISIAKEHCIGKFYHPTQKPVALLEYLVKTYTNEGDTVLDNCMGSGSTGVACINTNRNFIGIELDKGYFEIAERRISEVKNGERRK